MFVPAGSDRTYAELTADEKDAISHRGKAVRAIVDVMLELLAGSSSTGQIEGATR